MKTVHRKVLDVANVLGLSRYFRETIVLLKLKILLVHYYESLSGETLLTSGLSMAAFSLYCSLCTYV
jgi:hypothetical protein